MTPVTLVSCSNWTLCRCGWQVLARGSAGIDRWFHATVQRHAAVCPLRDEPLDIETLR